MIANYHTHTPRCNHAVGEEIEYVQAAIDGGLQILGFSDHTPQFFPGDYYSRMRMHPWELKNYVQAVQAVQKQYADKLQIHLGLEVEYYPALFGELIPYLQDMGIEYLLLGQHWNGNEEGLPYNGRPTEDEQQLKDYCNQVIDAIQTGLFTYIAHPDILHFTGADRVYTRHIRKLCEEAKKCSIPLELNLLGLREQRHYPARRFWEIAAEEGCDVILGSDAHDPIHVVQTEVESTAINFLSSLGLSPLETVSLINI